MSKMETGGATSSGNRANIIARLLDEGGVAYKQNGKSFILECPRCRKRDKLYIRKGDGRFVCWYCKEIDNFQGKPEFALAELLEQPLGEIRAKIWGESAPASVFLGIDLVDFYGEDDVIDPLSDPIQEVEMDPGFRSLDDEWSVLGVNYLANRGIPKEIAKDYGILYSPSESRIVFPVKSFGKLLGWQTRTIKDNEWLNEESGEIVKIPKALTYTGLKKDRVLMFSDRITGSHAILTEGPIDGIKAHWCGGNVVSMGKAVSSWQLELLRTSGIKKLYVALDPDASEECKRVVEELERDVEIYDMRAPHPFKDLGEMNYEQVYNLFLTAPKVSKNYFFLYLKDHYQ